MTKKVKDRFIKSIAITIFILVSIAMVIKFQGALFLRMYVMFGIGDCAKIPILCMTPGERVISESFDQQEPEDFISHIFSDMSIRVPRGFTVVEREIKRVYYKKNKHIGKGAIIYLLYRPPGSFMSLYPQLKDSGVYSDYEFFRRLMFADERKIKSINDAFFVIMKGIFTPDLGDQTKVQMAALNLEEISGFINYNIGGKENYFDCNIFDSQGNYFKIYIRDTKAVLDLDKVLAIISTASAN
ncbi:MAG: hypothetical protein ISS27_02145 [Candidatus Omnitrophica bacterium]|nr:hypothetical protein [Candidatus Omnitrophota bacterium]